MTVYQFSFRVLYVLLILVALLLAALLVLGTFDACGRGIPCQM